MLFLSEIWGRAKNCRGAARCFDMNRGLNHSCNATDATQAGESGCGKLGHAAGVEGEVRAGLVGAGGDEAERTGHLFIRVAVDAEG